MIQVRDYAEWRKAARDLLRRKVAPEQLIWASPDDLQASLFNLEPHASDASSNAVMIPRGFLVKAEMVSRHSDPSRWSLLYRVAWRLTHGEKHLLEIDVDDDIAAMDRMQRAVAKDIYRMRAFVRFRKVNCEEGERFVAWYEPEHRTLDANGKFFVDRFGSMRWAILTPDASLVWDLEKLEIGPGVPRSRALQESPGAPDAGLEDLWRLYYRTIYNPARMKLSAMRAQLPVSRWKNLPEAQAIAELVRTSRGRVQQMADAQPRAASDFIPLNANLAVLRDAVRQCGACELCRRATQPVWGEGDPQARIMLVGEQPGDEEDLAGRPFVGPAGQVLNQAMADAGLERAEMYLTNAVKAFKFEERGKRRIHQTPRAREISTCRPWLIAEIELVKPTMIVCLGANAAQSVLGRKVQIGAERGKLLVHGTSPVIVTYHPSAILRVPEKAMQQELYSLLVSDLGAAHRAVST